jgi:hypothetical protein
MSRQYLSADLAEVSLLRAAPRIGISQTKRRALSFVDLFTAAIAYEHGFTGHEILLFLGNYAFIVHEYLLEREYFFSVMNGHR